MVQSLWVEGGKVKHSQNEINRNVVVRVGGGSIGGDEKILKADSRDDSQAS